jgi:oxygen-independent coproporphyrinogen-3 oxidase
MRDPRSLTWTEEGFFAYPPKASWSPLAPEAAARSWRSAGSEPVGLYIHVPPEVSLLKGLIRSEGSHPYLKSLEREAGLLELPGDLRLRTLYIGGGGCGALAALSPEEIGALLEWVRRRFSLKSLEQSTLELDASLLDSDKVRVLSKSRVDRVAACMLPGAREAFGHGVGLLRANGFSRIVIDLVAGRPGQDAASVRRDVEFAARLAPDDLFVRDHSQGGLVVKEGPRADDNLQLADALQHRASVLGLGWGAVSHVRDRLLYGKDGSCFGAVDHLLRGALPPLRGAPLDRGREMRSHIIHALENSGAVDREVFRKAFGKDPEAAFPAEFAALLKQGRLLQYKDGLRAASKDAEQRSACSDPFYESAGRPPRQRRRPVRTPEQVRGLFRKPTRSPMWTQEGFFVYPPKQLWTPVSVEALSKAWGRADEAVGLYIHVPAEVPLIKDFFPSRRTHPYLESLEREAELLKLPKELPLRTVYIGGAGSGALSSLAPEELRHLFDWLRSRFSLKRLEQASVELDCALLTPEKARALARGKVDRVSACLSPGDGSEASRRARKAFSQGVRLLRRHGISRIVIDLVAGRHGQDAASVKRDMDFASKLSPNELFLCDYSTPGDASSKDSLRAAADLLAKTRPARRTDPLDNNLQLAHTWQHRASILGLGWGADSHLRGKLVYGKTGSCFAYVDSLLRRSPPLYAGAPLDPEEEMRSHIIHALEDIGAVDRETFQTAFKKDPEAAFPEEFSKLLKDGRLAQDREGLRVVSKDGEERYVCSVRFYGAAVLQGLSRMAAAGSPRTAPGGVDASLQLPARRRKEELCRLNREGIRFLGAKDPEAALRLFEQALRLDPADVNSLINKGAAASLQTDFKTALDAYERAIAACSKDSVMLPDALSAKAGVLLRLGRVREAVQDLSRALGAAPKGWRRRSQVEAELVKLLTRRKRT